MPIHDRRANSHESPRVQVKFTRHDLLWQRSQPLRSPDGRLVIECLPIRTPEGFVVGPTLLDMMTRDIEKIGGKEKAVWRIRDLRTLWRDGSEKKKPKREVGEQEKIPDHPFKTSLASGGKELGTDGQFIRVSKRSTVTISEFAFRVAIGMQQKSVDGAYQFIANLATDAWARDLLRARQIFNMIEKAGGKLIEDASVESLRPSSSISQEVEAEIMRACCRHFDVDPEMDISRPNGRPRGKDEVDAGKVIRLRVTPDRTPFIDLCADYHGMSAGTDLTSMDVMTLVEILGALRIDDLGHDADILETYLDASIPDWRERAMGGEESRLAPGGPNPYEVLNVHPEATMDQITQAWKVTRGQVHPDKFPKGISSVFFKMVDEAYSAICDERGVNK